MKIINSQEELLSVYNEKIKDPNSDWYITILTPDKFKILVFTKSISTLIYNFRSGFNRNKSWYVTYIPKDRISEIGKDLSHNSFGTSFNCIYTNPKRIGFVDKSSFSIKTSSNDIVKNILISNTFDELLREYDYYEFGTKCLIDFDWEIFNFITFLTKRNMDEDFKIDLIEFLSNYDDSSLCRLFRENEPNIKIDCTSSIDDHGELKKSSIKNIDNDLIKLLTSL